jgi:hypothetical protein
MIDSDSRPKISLDSSVENTLEKTVLSKSPSNLNEDSFSQLALLRLDSSLVRRSRSNSYSSSMTSESFENYINSQHTRPHSSTSSIIDISSPNISSSSPTIVSNIFLPITEKGEFIDLSGTQLFLKKIPVTENCDPVNIVNDIVYIKKNRLEELEYMKKYMKEIIELNVKLHLNSDMDAVEYLI